MKTRAAARTGRAGFVASYVTKEFPNLDGFVLFDQQNRYEIDFPKGWAREEKPMPP